MASASTNKTIWNLAIIGILGFLAWKLWPTIRKQLNQGGGGGGSVGGGGGGQSPYYPSQQQQSPNRPSASFGGGSGGSGGGFGSSLSSIWNSLVKAGTYAGSTPSQQDYVDSFLGAEQIDANNNWTPEIENLPLASYSPDDPNAPWNSGNDTGDYYPDDFDPSTWGDIGGGGPSGFDGGDVGSNNDPGWDSGQYD